MLVIKNFLHLRPAYIVRICSFADEYSIDRIWPEVLLCMDKDTAEKLRSHLVNAYKRSNTKCAHQIVQPICIFRVEEYNDEEFYSYVHRVPMSIKNLKKLTESTGYEINEDISYI